MPRFVLLHHECPASWKPSHWDLMLELQDALATWSLASLPSAWESGSEEPGDDVHDVVTLAAERIANHRLAYLDYEGPVSGDRGAVRRVDQGEFTWLRQSDDAYEVELRGARISGVASLRRHVGDQWNLQFVPRKGC